MDDDMEQEPTYPEAELAQLADGSLSSSRETELRSEVESSPALQRALAEQESAVSMLRAVDATAPASLRHQIEAMTAAASGRRRRFRLDLRFLVPATAALAAVAAVVVVLSLGAGAGGPSLPQTAQLALASATGPPPAPVNRVELNLSVDGIKFPNWGGKLGWRALGRRADTIGGQRIATVYYGQAGGYRVGYSIVSGATVPITGTRGRSLIRHGVRYTVGTAGPVRLVTWLRSGHTCVIAGRGVSDRALLALADAA